MLFINETRKKLLLQYKSISIYRVSTETVLETNKHNAEKDLVKFQNSNLDMLNIFQKIEVTHEISDCWVSISDLYVLKNREQRRVISEKYYRELLKKFKNRKHLYRSTT